MADISIILSVLNGMPYLPAAVESVLNQDHPDFELIINDNGSTDGSLEYVNRLAAEDRRIRVTSDGTNHGHSGGLNRALALSASRWTARMDADDICLPHRLSRQLAFLRDNPDVRLAGTLAHYIDQNGRRVAKTYSDLKSKADFDRYWRTGEMIGLMHPSVVFDTGLARELGGYREAFGPANDIDLWCRIAESGGTVLVQQEYLIEYRIHPGQISTKKFFEARECYEWARACALARRKGAPEPSLEDFRRDAEAVSPLQRADRFRKNHAKFFYRQAGMNWICGLRARALVQMCAAACLQPGYAIRRAIGQFRPST